ncbi:MAG: hypothetical protein EWV80_23765 [Microcystis aeruginosa Ma_QC_B_20070730_S2]|uniref:Uncharacterized protein n=1 Tax=Microcystis aeruginosa Ma_QC_B_20070730_S2 TaxID=2486256 RepID=A0A552D2A6_MICAE|nr:MAG: hypothetical protein EWV80_23765 [Microcystis aeruginosa Ma_QC_B_20070730_S2]
MRFDNVPFGRTQFAPTLWTKSVTVGAQSLRPPIDWDKFIKNYYEFLFMTNRVYIDFSYIQKQSPNIPYFILYS